MAEKVIKDFAYTYGADFSTKLDSVLSTPNDWELLASIDESESYEIDVTEVYRDGDKFVLALATGCSCWEGGFTAEWFDTFDELATSLIQEDHQYNPSLKGAEILIGLSRLKLGLS